MPSPAQPAPDTAWKTTAAILTVAFAIGVCWFVAKRSAAPAPPRVVLPYIPPLPSAAK